VLYVPFRKVLRQYVAAARAFDGHVGPEFLEEPAPELAEWLEWKERTQRQMRELLRYFPRAPPGGFGDNGPTFGPVLHSEDMRVAVSLMMPLALTLDENFPTDSYGPERFLREKCLLIVSTIEGYVGWRSYTVGSCRTRWRGFPPQVPADAFAGTPRVSPDEWHLTRLFANLTASANRCRRQIEGLLGRSAEEL
jgi:hypothetical protein